MRGKRWLAYALIGVVATLGLGACGGNGEEKQEVTGLLAAADVGGVPRFEPTTVYVRFGQEAAFTYQNKDEKREHSFTLPFIFVDKDNFLSVDVPPGQSRTIRFPVRERPRDGFLSFYCRFHQGEGMQGKIRFV